MKMKNVDIDIDVKSRYIYIYPKAHLMLRSALLPILAEIKTIHERITTAQRGAR